MNNDIQKAINAIHKERSSIYEYIANNDDIPPYQLLIMQKRLDDLSANLTEINEGKMERGSNDL